MGFQAGGIRGASLAADCHRESFLGVRSPAFSLRYRTSPFPVWGSGINISCPPPLSHPDSEFQE